MKYCLIILLFAITHIQVQSQPKLSHFYPQLKEFSSGLVQKLGKQMTNLYLSGCVSGNCKSGEGVWVIVTSVGFKSLFASNDDIYMPQQNYPLNISLYKGKFSKGHERFHTAGELFTGKVFTATVDYIYEQGKSFDKGKFVPRLSWQTSGDNEEYLIETGSYEMIEKAYRRSGEVIVNVKNEQLADLPLESLNTWNHPFGSSPLYIDANFKAGSKIKGMQGRALSKRELIGGRIIYADGSVFEGCLYQNKFFGPGRLKTSGGAIKEGIWYMDSLVNATSVYIPEALYWYVTPEKEMNGGLKYWSAANGWGLITHLYSPEYLTLGKLDAETKLQGAGFILKGNIFNLHRSDVDLELIYNTGTFSNDTLQEGARLIDFVSKQNGFQRVNSKLIYAPSPGGKVNGCGEVSLYRNGSTVPYEKKETDFWTNSYGEVQADGWGFLNDFEKKRDMAHLTFFYINQSIKEIKYESDLLKAIPYLRNNKKYCLPQISQLSQPVVAQYSQKEDSIKAIVAKRQKQSTDDDTEPTTTTPTVTKPTPTRPVTKEKTYRVGERVGDGIVFFVYDAGKHGLIASRYETSLEWVDARGKFPAPINTSTGLSDWYLPSVGELQELRNTTSAVKEFILGNAGGWPNRYIWTRDDVYGTCNGQYCNRWAYNMMSNEKKENFSKAHLNDAIYVRAF